MTVTALLHERSSAFQTHLPAGRSSLLTRHTPDMILRMSNEDDTDIDGEDNVGKTNISSIISNFGRSLVTKPPPIEVEDVSVLFYDVFLVVNLSLSISFWVTHRMSFEYIGSALSEGSLFSILWIAAGLYNGAFLNSAVDGHYGSTSDKGGPKAAGMLGLHTFIGAANLRLAVALGAAILQHRQVGVVGTGEELIPLEISSGLVLMSLWRAMHSIATPRI